MLLKRLGQLEGDALGGGHDFALGQFETLRQPVDHLTHKCFRRGCTGGDSNRSRPVKPGEIDVQSALYQMGDATGALRHRSEEHTSELQSIMRISYAVFCLKKKKHK